jgi:hypothetical protein
MARISDSILHKNPKTGKIQTIKINGIGILDWGFHFFIETETDAYLAAYHYRNSMGGCKVEFAGGIGKWMVTVFNKNVPEGIDRS